MILRSLRNLKLKRLLETGCCGRDNRKNNLGRLYNVKRWAIIKRLNVLHKSHKRYEFFYPSMSLCPLIFQLEIRKLLDSKSNLISSRNETISLDSFITREGRRRKAVIAQSVVRPIDIVHVHLVTESAGQRSFAHRVVCMAIKR